MKVGIRLPRIEFYLLVLSVFLIVLGSMIVAFDQAGYLMAKRKLEIDNLAGTLPSTGLDSYLNKTQILNIKHQYNYLNTIGVEITALGFWVLSFSLIAIGLIDTSLSEKLRLALIFGAIVIMLLMAYGLYNITLSVYAGFGT
jgi:hypothetical protein